MIDRLSAKIYLACVVLWPIGIGHAAELMIKCNDENHCDRSFYSAREWVVQNGILERNSSQATADKLFDAYLFGESQRRAVPQEKTRFETAPSEIDGTVWLSGKPYPKNLLLSYKISFKDKETIRVFANCANIFRCTPTAKEELTKLVAFVESNDPVVLKTILTKQELRKQKEVAQLKQQERNAARAEELEAKFKQNVQEQVARRKASQADVEKVGAMVCWYNLGATENFSGTPKYISSPVGDGYRIKGFTENFQNQKIQVRISSIRYGSSEVNEAPRFNATKGGIIWVLPDNWEICLEE